MKLTENVMQLGNRHFNFFVVGQKKAAIVECGVNGGVVSFNQQWIPWLEKPAIHNLVVSHAHFDHVCGIPALRRLFPQAKLLASAEAQKVLSRTKILDNFFSQDDKMSEVLMDQGLVPEKISTPVTKEIAVDEILGEGDRIDLGKGLRLEVMDAPGHSPCSLAFYLPGDKVMFLSDAAGFQISDEAIFPIFFQGYEMYMETIKRLMTFPTMVLGTPHERVWVKDDIADFYQRAINSAQNAFSMISRMLDSSKDEKVMRQNLFEIYYQGNLRIYTPENINICLELLIRRVKECL